MSDSTSPSIVVVGSLNVDLITYMSRFPAPGETLMGTSFAQGPGGKGANQAAAAAALSAPNAVAMVGAVGDDSFGRDYLAAFAASGVATDLVAVVPRVSTGVAPIWVDASGENAIVVVPGANAHVTPDSVAAAFARLPYVSTVLCQLEIPHDATLAALRAAAAARAVAFFTPAPAPPGGLPDDAFLALSSVLIPNLGEARALARCAADAPPVHAAGALLSRGAGAVVVTLGSAGCLVVTLPTVAPVPLPSGAELAATPHGSVVVRTVPAVRVARVIDTTGAGDCFSGSLAFFYSHLAAAHAPCVVGASVGAAGVPVDWACLVEAARRAVYVAGSSVTRRGTQSSYVPRSELPACLFDFTTLMADIPGTVVDKGVE